MLTWIVVIAVLSGLGVFVQRQITAPARRRKWAVNDALKRASALVVERPQDDDAKVQLARVHLELAGEPRRALEILEAVDRSNPHHWSGDEKPTRMLVGEAYVGLGQLDRAIEVFRSFLGSLPGYDTANDSERKWQLETHKVDCEQRIRLLERGDTHVHQPEQWGDTAN